MAAKLQPKTRVVPSFPQNRHAVLCKTSTGRLRIAPTCESRGSSEIPWLDESHSFQAAIGSANIKHNHRRRPRCLHPEAPTKLPRAGQRLDLSLSARFNHYATLKFILASFSSAVARVAASSRCSCPLSASAVANLSTACVRSRIAACA